jgi:branched-subunit amino acid aminotransferase/4-amino-4-deoxychorismate lyase
MRVEIDGVPGDDNDAERVTAAKDGHFTAMQVRSGAVRGWDHHLERLDMANREMFDSPLPPDRVRELIRHALGSIADASVRVVAFRDGSAVRTAVTIRDPFTLAPGTQILKSIAFQRPSAHLKRLNNPGHGEAIDAAVAAGFDDALLVSVDGEISEGGITNIGFWDGTHVLWPSAPALAGITWQVVEPLLPSRRGRVFRSDVPSFAGVFVTNSRGIVAVSRIDDVEIPVDESFMEKVHAAYDSAPWTEI